MLPSFPVLLITHYTSTQSTQTYVKFIGNNLKISQCHHVCTFNLQTVFRKQYLLCSGLYLQQILSNYINALFTAIGLEAKNPHGRHLVILKSTKILP